MALPCASRVFLSPGGAACKEDVVEDRDREIRLTVIYDNQSTSDELQAAWGFSCLIEGLERTILFDTGGQGATLMANMEEIGIDPSAVDAVFLSHRHWDHTGGLQAFLQANGDVTVHALASFPRNLKDAARRSGARVVETEGAVDVCRGAQTTGEMSRENGTPEQSLVIGTGCGAVVITGCAHPGVVEIAERAAELAGCDILAVVGGYHLHGAGDGVVREVAERLKALGVGYVAPCHCTGDRAMDLLRQDFGDRCLSCGAGETIEIGRLECGRKGRGPAR